MGCNCGKADPTKWAVVLSNGKEVPFETEAEAQTYLSSLLPGPSPYRLRAPYDPS